MTFDFQNPQWVVAVATFLAVLVALFKDNFLIWFNRSKIKLGLSNATPHVVQSVGSIPQLIKYFRLRVINKGRWVAKNCLVKIISIKLKDNSKESLIEPDRLIWSSAPLDMNYRIENPHISEPEKLNPIFKEKKDISPYGGWEFCDLFLINTFNLTKLFFNSLDRREVPINREYEILIEVTGDNFKPKRAKIETFIQEEVFNTRIEWLKN